MKPAPPACPHCRKALEYHVIDRTITAKPHCQKCDWVTCTQCGARIGRWTHLHDSHESEGCPGAHT